MRGWLLIAGTNPVTAKYLSAAGATLTVVAFAAWARRFLGLDAATRGGILLAVSPILVGNAATVRDPAVGLFFLALNCWAYCEIIAGSTRARWTVVYLATGLLALWTSFLAAGVLLAEGLTLAARGGGRRRFGLLAAIVVGILPWLVFALSQGWLATLGSGGPAGGSTAPSFVAELRMAVSLLLTGSDATRGWVLLLVVASAAIALGPGARGLLSSSGARYPWTVEPGILPLRSFLIIGLGITSAFALGISASWLRLGIPARYLAPVLLFWLVLVSALGNHVARPRAWLGTGILVLVNVVNLVGWFRQPSLPPSFWNPLGVQRFLDEHVGPADHVIFLTLEQAGYYQALSKRAQRWLAIPVGTPYLERNVTEQLDRQVSPLLRQDQTIWLVEYRGIFGPGQRSVEGWLASHAYPVTPTALSDSEVHPFITDTLLDHDRPVDAHFAEGVVLGNAAFPSDTRPGTVLPVRLTWHADHPLARDLTVFVHLVSQRGQTITQQDLRPVDGEEPTTRWRGAIVDRHALLLPANAAAGTYWIEVGLYDSTGRLAVAGRDDGTVRLGPVSIR